MTRRGEGPLIGTIRASELGTDWRATSHLAYERTYRIIRFRQNEPNFPLADKTGLTLEEAQAHCQDPATRGDGWFDGYEEEES
jgi:hypothetical protein